MLLEQRSSAAVQYAAGAWSRGDPHPDIPYDTGKSSPKSKIKLIFVLRPDIALKYVYTINISLYKFETLPNIW